MILYLNRGASLIGEVEGGGKLVSGGYGVGGLREEGEMGDG
jgi:hypothetical protein